MKIVKLKPEVFDEYIESTDYCSYFQSSKYAHIANHFNLKAELLGITEKNELVGAFILLNKNIFLNFKYGYSPRGIIIDYNNQKLVEAAFKELKNYLMRERYLMLKIDPLILNAKYDKKGNIIAQNENAKSTIELMKKIGFTHAGLNKYFESIKPRTEAELDLRFDSKELFNNLSKQTRNKLRKATKYGLKVYDDNKCSLQDIYPFIKDKAREKLKYYEQIQSVFKDNFEIYYAKLNTKVYVENSKYLYEKEMEINDYLTNIIQSNGYKGKNMNDIINKKMESDKLLSAYKNHMVISTDLLKQHPEGIIVGATLTIKHKNKVFLIVEGFNKEYHNLCANYLTKWKIIEKYSNSEIEFFNMNGISSDYSNNNPYKGLNEMKFSYGSYANEYIGELDLIINNPMYSIYKSMTGSK